MIKRLLLLLSALSFSALPVFAQTPSSQPTDLETLKNDYFFQFEKYDDARDKFILERAEFHKLGTLASQEDAVAAMRSLMLARAHTHSAYLAILDNLLVSTQAVDLLDRQQALDELQQTQASIDNHIELAQNLADKTDVVAESARYEKASIQIFISQYRILSLLSISRVQAALDQLIVAADDFQTDIVDKIDNQDFKATNERGLKEVAILLNNSIAAVDKARARYTLYDSDRNKDRPDGIHNNVVRELQPAYANMQKAVDFLIELERGAN